MAPRSRTSVSGGCRSRSPQSPRICVTQCLSGECPFPSVDRRPSDSHEESDRLVTTRRAGRAERAIKNSARHRCGINSTGTRGAMPCHLPVRRPVGAKSPINNDIVSRLAPVRSFALIAFRNEAEVITCIRTAVTRECSYPIGPRLSSRAAGLENRNEQSPATSVRSRQRQRLRPAGVCLWRRAGTRIAYASETMGLPNASQRGRTRPHRQCPRLIAPMRSTRSPVSPASTLGGTR
jgi:hypothetical protein